MCGAGSIEGLCCTQGTHVGHEATSDPLGAQCLSPVSSCLADAYERASGILCKARSGDANVSRSSPRELWCAAERAPADLELSTNHRSSVDAFTDKSVWDRVAVVLLSLGPPFAWSAILDRGTRGLR